MASIERTAYPRFQPIPHARELTEYFTPTAEGIAFGVPGRNRAETYGSAVRGIFQRVTGSASLSAK